MTKRNYGIDLLRILSMLMVVMLHILGRGGILSAAAKGSANYYTAWLLEITSICAVNCFGLISGYVMYRSKARATRLLELWLQTVFYTVGITLGFYLLQPGSVTADALWKALLPVTTKHYWYISAYFGMYLLLPVLVAALEQVEQKVLRRTLLACVLLFALLPSLLGTDPFSLKNGYSMLWLCLLFLAGGYIRKYELHLHPALAFGLFGGAVLLTFGWKAACEGPLHLPQYANLFVRYTSPTIVLAGIALLLGCTGLRLSEGASKVICGLAPAALGVYLIHVSQPVWAVLQGVTAPLAALPTWQMVLYALAIATAIYLSCTVIEWLRIGIFKLLALPFRRRGL